MTFAGRGRFNQPNATAMQTITMDANAMMEELHDRMPVILERRFGCMAGQRWQAILPRCSNRPAMRC